MNTRLFIFYVVLLATSLSHLGAEESLGAGLKSLLSDTGDLPGGTDAAFSTSNDNASQRLSPPFQSTGRQPSANRRRQPFSQSLKRQEWKIDGVIREALVHTPSNATTNPLPVVFAFHGHGGTMRRASEMFRIHDVWPEAIAVYMQGLNTPGQLTDPEGKKPGWQKFPGDQNDRDLKFFDEVLKSLEKTHRVDKNRIYSTGHSNGGAFTYLLWATRGEQFAAFAPSAAVGRTLIDDMQLPFPKLQPFKEGDASATKWDSSAKRVFLQKPVFHIAGDNDPLVKYAWQKMMLGALRKKNQCKDGEPWRKDKRCTIYPSETQTPVVTYIHSRLHQFPADAPELIAEFFKVHSKP